MHKLQEGRYFVDANKISYDFKKNKVSFIYYKKPSFFEELSGFFAFYFGYIPLFSFVVLCVCASLSTYIGSRSYLIYVFATVGTFVIKRFDLIKNYEYFLTKYFSFESLNPFLRHKRTFKKLNTKRLEYVLPHAQGCYMKYKLTGDFSKYVKNVNWYKITHGKDYNKYQRGFIHYITKVVFEFTSIPKSGYLNLLWD